MLWMSWQGEALHSTPGAGCIFGPLYSPISLLMCTINCNLGRTHANSKLKSAGADAI